MARFLWAMAMDELLAIAARTVVSISNGFPLACGGTPGGCGVTVPAGGGAITGGWPGAGGWPVAGAGVCPRPVPVKPGVETWNEKVRVSGELEIRFLVRVGYAKPMREGGPGGKHESPASRR